MANEKFTLNFLSDGYGLKSIDEPAGYASAEFVLKQEDKRYARDISFSGGEAEFIFYDLRKHELEQLIYYHSRFGWEAKVNFSIEFEDSLDFVIGNLDFQFAETDGLTYFKCKVIQDNKQAILKRRKTIKVNLLSDKDLDGNAIDPLVPDNILLKAKPIVQISEWKQPTSITQNTFGGFVDVSFNYANAVLSYGIQDTLSYIQGYNLLDEFDQFRYLFAANTLKDIKIDVTNFVSSVLQHPFAGGASDLIFYYAIGEDSSSAVKHEIDALASGQEFQNTYSVNIPIIPKGQILWMWFKLPTFAEIRIDSIEIKITATSVAYNTITPAFRLYDVLKYITKSISGMEIVAPRFQPGGEFYDQRLFNGNFLRNITDKGFFITLKDIEDSLPELNGDYEIQPDNTVFFGLYEDFYRPIEIGFFNSTQFDSLVKGFNPRYALNEFSFGYKNYQSQKENSKDNTVDAVNGESQWLLPNQMVENKKPIDIEWVRDAFLIEETRRKAIEDNDTKATQDDDKIFCIDTTELQEFDRVFKETALLQHSYESTTGYNTIRNSGDFSFILLGIAIGDNFEIITPVNVGNHTVIEVTSRTVILQRTSPGSSTTTGAYNTEFRYRISEDTANFVNWTDEGFTLINNIENGDNFANLRFSIKRNIINFWNSYLATANLYNKLKAIKNTFYKNNPDALTVYEGSQVMEGDDFIPENPILSPEFYKNVTFICEPSFYKNLENQVRTQRGFVRSINNEGVVFKGFPQNMSYSNYEKRLICDLEVKYEPSDMTITTEIPGVILINNETRLHSILYAVENEKIIIFDENEEPMYNPMDWFKISVNGAVPSTLYELTGWLDLL